MVNHVGLVTVAGGTTTAMIVEASTVVKRHRMSVYRNSKSTKVAVYRPLNVHEEQIKHIVSRANSYVGAKYGYAKIVAHFLDWCIGGRYFFRRFAFMDRYPICSWVVASAYADVNLFFGVEPGEASPDDIWDFVTSNPDKYGQVYPLELLP
jgi:hypothetical protein